MIAAIEKKGMYHICRTLVSKHATVRLKIGTKVLVREERTSKQKNQPKWIALAKILHKPERTHWYRIQWLTQGPLQTDRVGTEARGTYPLRLLMMLNHGSSQEEMEELIGTFCSEIYIVKNVICKREREDDPDVWEYLVAWEGWPFSASSWLTACV